MAKYVSASKAAAMLGLNEKTVRNLIERGEIQASRVTKKRFNVSMDEIRRVAMKRGIELEQDTEVSIASLDLELLKLRERVDRLEQLRERLEQLEQRLERAEKPIAPRAPAESPTTMKEERQHTTTPTASQGTLPGDYRSFTDFFREHGIPETTAGRAGDSFEVKRGNWRTATGKQVKKALDADGQVQFCQFFSTHQTYHQCEIADCPCHTLATQQ